MTSKPLLVASLALISAAALSTGCSDTGIHALRLNPTPELSHVNRSTGQVRNDHARIMDNQTRALWDDIDRLLFMDGTAARLTPSRFP